VLPCRLRNYRDVTSKRSSEHMSDSGRGRDELLVHFRDQLGFLRSSAEAFDQGNDAESKRIAVALRVLLHNTKESTSVFKQLGVQHQIRFLDTAAIPQPAKPGTIVRRFDPGLAVIEMGQGTARFKAPLNDDGPETYGPQLFRQWWNRPVLEDLRRESFTRKDLVLFMANKQGAHVDPAIKPRLFALTRLNSLGWGLNREGDTISLVVPAGPDDEPMGNPVPANIRQIAYEVERTVEIQLRELVEASSRLAS